MQDAPLGPYYSSTEPHSATCATADLIAEFVPQKSFFFSASTLSENPPPHPDPTIDSQLGLPRDQPIGTKRQHSDFARIPEFGQV